MSRLLDKLYNGDICPMEHTRPRDPEYEAVNRALSDQQREWEKRLSEEKQEEWRELEDLYTALTSIELRTAFGRGFCLGQSLIAEIYEDWPAKEK